MGIINRIYNKRMSLRLTHKEEALREAKRIAEILGEQFGASEVILYGSLAKDAWFDAASDIDLAVKGLGDNYLTAYGYCLGISRFNLDIKPYEDMPEKYSKTIAKEGRFLYARSGN